MTFLNVAGFRSTHKTTGPPKPREGSLSLSSLCGLVMWSIKISSTSSDRNMRKTRKTNG
ncbi:hypothetical protein GBAR_LOCUS12420 [Geodia barretti]|uniref:Uncharacterized protein n=1 Tax=Geodia barretti TaxID=519541 RepID=A0AA35WHL9_GEOBA|nr:hypothetical protein GBAR_LOCUS12420 [Geodia barretti]